MRRDRKMRLFIVKGSLYLALIIFMVLLAKYTDAQVVENGIRQYRVTAFEKGDTSITSVSNIAEVVPPMTIYVPDAFTPNGDGVNDSFGVSGENIWKFKMLVYNSWGELVFQTDDVNKRWECYNFTIKDWKKTEGFELLTMITNG